MANYGMAFDYKLCINCKACEVACKEENGIELGAASHRLWVESPNFDGNFLQYQCQQCQDAPCLKACPNDAIYRDKNGIIRLYDNKCDLSLDCVKACPYDARYVDTRKKITDKCIFCADTRLARGEMTTACQITCPAKLRIFGDLDDPNSDISRVLKTRDFFQLQVEKGTKPKLYYLK